jgi:Hint module
MTKMTATAAATETKARTAQQSAAAGYEWALAFMGTYNLRYSTNFVEQCPDMVDIQAFSLVSNSYFGRNSSSPPLHAIEVSQTDMYADGTQCSSKGALSLQVIEGDTTGLTNLVVSGRDDALRGCYPYKMRGSTTLFNNLPGKRDKLVKTGRLEGGMFEYAAPGDVYMGFTDSGSLDPWGCWYEKYVKPVSAILDGSGSVNDTLNWDGHPTCFSGDSTAELENGGLKRMDALEIGDRVKVAKGEFSDIYMFSHKIENTVNTFVEISTSASSTMSLTPGHYLYVNGILKAAEEVKIGDSVELGCGNTARVTTVNITSKRGLYNPHTLHGDIIVNNVRASTYTSAVDPKRAHLALSLFRTFYRITGSDVSAGLLHRGAPWSS